MYLGWDVGIRNLAYCLIDYQNNSMKVIDWGVISLVKNHCREPVYCGTNTGNQKVCGKIAS